MDSTSQTTPPAAPAAKVFVIRVTDPTQDHDLLGYAFVQQTAFFPSHPKGDASPEVAIVLEGLQRMFEKGGEYALAAVPFDAQNDATSSSLMIGANVSGANVDPDA